MTNCYLVMGTPRSGTSCVAGILHRLGIRMTLGEFAPPTDANPTGFYEDESLNINIGGIDPSRGLYHAERYMLRQRLRSIIEERERPGVDWGAKTYRLSFVLDDWISLAKSNVKLIFTERSRESSRASWLSAFGGYARIIDDVADRLKDRRAGQFSVSFDSLLNSPATEVRRIAEFCGRQDKEESIHNAIGFVNASLRKF